MKHAKIVWIVAAVVAIVYVATLFFVRVESQSNMQRRAYEGWRQNYVVSKNGHEAFVNTSNDGARQIALSEGQGYGMYLTAAAGSKGLARRQDFDDLLHYYLQHRDVVGGERNISTYLMQWRQYNKGDAWVSQDNSATDGDLYIAASLYRASTVWPSRASQYREIGRRLTNDILSYEYNDATHTLTVGDWATEGSQYYNLMRTSDVMPVFFDEFYRSTHDKRWLMAKDAMLDRLSELSGEYETGLVPDFAWVTEKDARAVHGKTVASVHDGAYSFNACRVPMMLASSSDPRAKAILHRLLRFFNQQETLASGYSLDGERLNNYQSNSFTVPLVYAASQSRQGEYDRILLNKHGILTEPIKPDSYYDATLTTMALVEGMN